MNNLKFVTLSMLLAVNSQKINSQDLKKDQEKSEVKVQKRRTIFDRMRAIEREMDEMFNMRTSSFGDFFEHDSSFDVKEFQDVRKIDVKKEDENVIVTITLPENVKYNDIKIKAKGNNLDGSLNYNDHKLNFYVRHGREFSSSVEYNKQIIQKEDDNSGKNKEKEVIKDQDQAKIIENKKEEAQKSEKYNRVFSSWSSQSTWIPLVTNLENAKVSVEKNLLKITLPRAHSKRDWKNIEVQEGDKY